ncbi:MAG TPA: sigma-70 family RNA polymerase sigma factor [Blastocatellia bacterium]|nr:sigma-70 family RNA polymerase sigma factor [Blastocatellia bacterium]
MESCAVSQRAIDKNLIEACQRGDREAFRDLFEAYQDRVYSIALHYSGEVSAARDITQQVFLKLFSCITQFRQDSEFTTWLYRLVANTCLDEKRRTKRLVSIEEDGVIGYRSKESIEDDFSRHEMSGSVQAAIRELSPKLRLPILLKYVEGLSYDEIALVLNCSQGTVASRLNRGHKALAERLAHLRSAIRERL